MSVWKQVRSWFAWPTDALLVGPDTSSLDKWLAWGLSFVLGMGLGLASCHISGMALFTSGSNDNVFSNVFVVTAVLFIPLVCVAFVLPRIGGLLLVVGACVMALVSLPALSFQVGSALGAVLVFALPMLLVGLGFTWSGLRRVANGPAGSRV